MTFSSIIPSAASKCGHDTKKHVLIGFQTWRFLPPNIWSLKAVKANCCAKAKLFICFWSARSAHISFFSTFRHISRSESVHLPPESNLTSNNSCKEYFVERKRIKSTTAACSKLRMFGGQNRSCLHPIRTCLLLTYVYTLRCNRRYY